MAVYCLAGSITICLEQNLVMNAKLFLLCVATTVTAYAGDPPSAQFKSSALKPIPLDPTARFQNFLTQKDSPSVIALGRSDFVFSGPLVTGFRRLPHEDHLNIGQKFLRLPVIRLFVPGPMPMPPEGGPKYFAWRSEEGTQPWTVAASRRDIRRGPGQGWTEAEQSEPNWSLFNISLGSKRSAVP